MRSTRSSVPAAALMLAAVSVLAAGTTAQQADSTASPGEQHSRGRELFLYHRCSRCHEAPPSGGGISDWAHAALGAPDLRNAGRTLDPDWVTRWLVEADQATHSVPHQLHGDSAIRDARDLAAWLARAGGKPFQRRAIQRENKRGAELFVTRGCAACHSEATQTGSIDDGRHRLPNLARKTGADQLAEFLQSPEARWPDSRMPDLQLNRGDARAIAEALCFVEESPRAKQPAGNAKRGQRRAHELGCGNCHRLPGPPAKTPARHGPRLAALATRTTNGCLAETPPPEAMVFQWTDAERQALRAFLAQSNREETPSQQLDRRVHSLRCLSCHTQGEQGGMGETLRAKFHRLCDEDAAELMDAPALTALESRLHSTWVDEVLTKKTRARPYLALRMPHYARSQTKGLAKLWFAGRSMAAVSRQYSLDTIEHGRQIIGSTGLSCIICHDFRGQPGVGSHGPDFTAMHRRLQPDFLRRWIENPQAIDPGTRMPAFFQAGKSSAAHILEGDANAQIDAIVAYLAQGDRMTAPVGLAPPPDSILVVEDRMRVMRTILPNLGPRSIALGFPGGLSVALDLGTPRLGYVWLGSYLDMGRKWTGRGNGPSTLIGERLLHGPLGSMFRRGNVLSNARLLGYERAPQSIEFRFRIDDREDAKLSLRAVRSSAGVGLELSLTSEREGLELALGKRTVDATQPNRLWLTGTSPETAVLALGSVTPVTIGRQTTVVLRSAQGDTKATLWFLTDSSSEAVERLEQQSKPATKGTNR